MMDKQHSVTDFTCQVNIDDARWSENLDHVENFIDKIVGQIFLRLDYSSKNMEVSFLLADDCAVQALNKQYRGKDKPTNVLSFPTLGDDDEVFLGDIAVAYDTIKNEAEQANITIKDHFAHMIVHGVLHLLGYDHQDDDQAEIMESLEVDILHMLNIKNPYEK